MPMTPEEIAARRAAIDAERRQLHEAAGNAELDETAAARWAELDTETAELDTEAVAAEERAAAARRVAESRSRWQSTRVSPNVPTTTAPGEVSRMYGPELRSRALALVDSRRGEAAGATDAQRAQIARMVSVRTEAFDGEQLARRLLVTESDAYRSGFQQVILRGSAAILEQEEAIALRAAMAIGADSTGGYALPVLIDPTIIITDGGHPNPFFRMARVEPITTDEWKGVTGAGAVWYWGTEAAAATDGAPSLAQPTVPARKVTGWIPFSVEVQGDYPSFGAEMGRLLRSGYDEAVVAALTTGSGTSMPTGIVTAIKAASGTHVAVTTDGQLGAVDFYKIKAALPMKYRQNAEWMFSTNVENAARQFAAGSTGDANFSVNITADGIGRFLGYARELNDYMDAPATTSASDGVPAILADWKNFLVAPRVGMTVETVQHLVSTTTGTPTGQRGLWAWARLGSGLVNPAGFKALRQSP